MLIGIHLDYAFLVKREDFWSVENFISCNVELVKKHNLNDDSDINNYILGR